MGSKSFTFDVRGPDTGLPVVLLHGLWLNRKMWIPLSGLLSKEFRTIAIDLPGHGSRIQDSFSLGRAAQAVESIVAREAPDGALVVGLSLGGYVSIELAARIPNRIAGLVLSSCSTNLNSLLPLIYSGAFFAPLVFGKRAHSTYAEWMLRARYGPAADPVLDAGIRLNASARSLKELIMTDYSSRLSCFDGPTLFLNGKRDHAFRRKESSFIAACKDPRLELIAHAGHMVAMQQPIDYAESIRRFVERAIPQQN